MIARLRAVLSVCTDGCYFVKDRFVWRCSKCGATR
jgi:hypothetical protein